MRCPRCTTDLIALGVAEGQAAGCERCGGSWPRAPARHGVWFDRGELEFGSAVATVERDMAAYDDDDY